MGFPNPNALSLPLMAQPTDPASWWMWQHPMPTGLDEVVTDIMSGNKKFDFLLMSRCGITWLLMCAKKEKGLTFVDIAKKVHRSEVWTTAAMFGQHSMTADEANNLLNALGFNPKEHKLGARIASILQCPPMRGTALILPHDPTIYRFYELVQVYGPTLKALIAEKFGDGIMSAVDLKMYVEKEQDSGPWPPGPGGVVGALPDGAFGPEWRGLQQLQQQHAGTTGGGVPLTPPNGPNTGSGGMWSNGKERVKITISGAFLPYRKW
jgi:cyanate lyase